MTQTVYSIGQSNCLSVGTLVSSAGTTGERGRGVCYCLGLCLGSCIVNRYSREGVICLQNE